MKRRVVFTAWVLMAAIVFCCGSVMAEKINTPITGWQSSFWNRPEESGIGEQDGGVEITTDTEWVSDGKGALHVWVKTSAPNFYAQASQNIEFEKGASYRLTGKIYLTSTSWGFGLYIGSQRLSMLRDLIPTAKEWADLDYTFTYQGDSKDFKLQVAQAGDLYADNLSLKKILYNQDKEVIGYGEELLKNGDFEDDYKPAGEVTELTAEAADAGAILYWKNPNDGRLKNIVILVGENVIKTVDGTRQSAEIDGLENGVTYTLTVKTQTESGVLSEGRKVTVTPYRKIPLPLILKDDKENRIIGMTAEMEYSVDEGKNWTKYRAAQPPELSGTVTVWVRYFEENPVVPAPIQILHFTPNAAGAEQIAVSKARFEGNELVLEGTLNVLAETTVTMYTLCQGTDRRDLSKVLAIGQTLSGADGDFSFHKPVSELRGGKATDGFYTVYLDSAVTDEIAVDGIAFASSQNLKNAVDALFTYENTAELLETDSLHYTAYLAMGFPLKDYLAQPAQKAEITADFKTLLAELNPNGDNLNAAVCGAFVKAYVMNNLRECNAESAYSILKEYAEFLELSYNENTLEAVMKEDSPRTVFLMKYLSGKGYQRYEDLKRAFAEGIALYEINQATYGILPQVMAKHSAALNLNSSEYAEYAALDEASSQKITVSKKIVDIKSKSPFQSREQVLDAVRAAMNDRESGGSHAGGGNGGGNGGFGGGSGGGSVQISGGTPTKENETTAPAEVQLFGDLNQAEWARESVEYLYRLGYVKGYEDGSFRPERLITREEFVTILVNAFQIMNPRAKCDFEDVAEQDWYYGSVASAVQAGVVNGMSENSFGTGEYITREAIAALAYRCIRAMTFDEATKRAAVEFADSAQISEYAAEAVSELYQLGVLNGYQDGRFLPQNTASRAEACKILHGILMIAEGK